MSHFYPTIARYAKDFAVCGLKASAGTGGNFWARLLGKGRELVSMVLDSGLSTHERDRSGAAQRKPNEGLSHASLGETRPILRRIRELLAGRPELAERHEAAKRVVRAFRKPAFYEVSERCNLWCEGCYYFESTSRELPGSRPSIASWREFFSAEAERHVTMAYFVGAEPALEQERLLAAAEHFPYGNIGTNGTIRIDPAIPYRIGVSVWGGDDATDQKLRGASTFRKALSNYAGDPRAIILFTLSSWNLDSVRTVAKMCRDNGLPLTFNIYSPTHSFLSKLQQRYANDRQYFRVSRRDDTPELSSAELVRARRIVLDLMDEFPETVVYSRAYNDWVTQPTPLHELNPDTGIAAHCGSRIIGQMRYHGPDLQVRDKKCCTPDVDCSRCRMYSGGWSSKFQPSWRDVVDVNAFSDWIDMMEVLGQIFLYEKPDKARQNAAS